MTPKRSQQEDALAHLDPIDEIVLHERWSRSEAKSSLFRAVTGDRTQAGSAGTAEPGVTSPPPARMGLRVALRRTLALGAAVAIVAAITTLSAPDRRGETGRVPGTVWAPELVSFAEAAPRLLIDEDGWRVTRAHELDEHEGEMTFLREADRVDLHWRPSESHDDYVRDRQHGAEGSWPITVLGEKGTLFRYEGTTSFTAIWADETHSLEMRVDSFETHRELESLTASLVRVDVDTWLNAMPESVVKPDHRAVAVEEILRDVPLPEGFEVEPLKHGAGISDSYQLGARVTSAVACAWIEQWIEASSNGETARRDEAVSALGTSRDWDVLHRMQTDGAWSEVLWSYADAIVAEPGGGPAVVAGYPSGLGCEND